MNSNSQGSIVGVKSKKSDSENSVVRKYKTPYLDIPPHLRNVMIVLSLAGMICAVLGSLMAPKGVAVGADKIVHFVGYTLLGMLLIMGLQPKLWPFGIIGVAGLSAGLEMLQPMFGRTMDLKGDLTTNCLAVATGVGFGIVGRFIGSYIRTEMVNADIRKATVEFADGQVIFRQGEASDKFFVVRSGKVSITRESNGLSAEIETVEPGGVFGEMGVIQNSPRLASAAAKGRCQLLGFRAADLLDKRSDGQDHPGNIVACILAKRLRTANEKLALLEEKLRNSILK